MNNIPLHAAAVIYIFAATLVAQDTPAPAQAVSRAAPASPAADTNGPGTQSHLDDVESALKQALSVLQTATASRFGGNTEKAIAAVEHAQADLKEAVAYAKAHPEINSLQNGPAPAETTSVRPAAIPNGGSFPAMISVLRYLNAALSPLLNNTTSDYKGPVLGDIGGFRVKLLNDIDQASKAVLAGIQFAYANNPGANGNVVQTQARGQLPAVSARPPPPPLKENVTLSVKGTTSFDNTIDFSQTGSGATIEHTSTDPNSSPPGVTSAFKGVISENSGVFKLVYTLNLQVPISVSTSSKGDPNQVNSAVSYMAFGYSSSVMLTPGQPVVVVDDDGKTITITLSLADNN